MHKELSKLLTFIHGSCITLHLKWTLDTGQPFHNSYLCLWHMKVKVIHVQTEYKAMSCISAISISDTARYAAKLQLLV